MDFATINLLLIPRLHLLLTNGTVADSSANQSDKPGAQELSLLQLFLALCAPIAMILLSIHLKLDIGYKIVISITRTIVQLLFAGCILLGIIFSIKSPILVVSYLFLMSMIAAQEVTTRQTRTYKGHYLDALISVLMGSLVSFYGACVVFKPTPFWDPHILIPTSGMIIGGAMSGPALACDRLLSDVVERSYEPEVRLAFGGNRYEAVLPMLRASIKSAMMPNLNGMAVVGLVNIPGMMTGQLLGGSSPYVAAEYQMAILWLIFTSAFLSTCTATYLTIKHAIFGDRDTLTTNKIMKRSDLKGMDVRALELFTSIRSHLNNLFTQGQRDTSAIHLSVELYSAVPVFERSKSSISSDATSIETGVDEEDPPTIGGLKTSSSRLRLANELDSNVYKANYNIAPGGKDIGTHNTPFFKIKNFNVPSGDLLLFGEDGFSIEVRKGEIITVEGCSGIGKTRLLRALAQLDNPTSGNAELVGVDGVTSQSAFWRRHVIYIPQALPSLTGSPKEFLIECCNFSSRIKLEGTQVLLSSKLSISFALITKVILHFI